MKQFTGIELCRFLCALSVIIWHYQHFFFFGAVVGTVYDQIRPELPFYRFLKPFYYEGFFAVQVFWTISGFIFFWKYSNVIHNGSISGRNFFVLRFTRLYPLHFATLFLVLILQSIYRHSHQSAFIYHHNDLRHFVMQLFFASNWLGRQPFTFNGPIWSVSLEVFAYLTFFILLRFFSPNLILCLVVILITRLLFHFHPDLALSCITFFFAGGLLEQSLAQLDKNGRDLSLWSATGALIIIGLSLYLGAQLSLNLQLFLSFVLVAWFSLIEDKLPHALASLRWVGNMTYSSYLLHFPIQLLIVTAVDALGIQRKIFFAPEAFVFFILITFASAHLTYEYFEKPTQDVLRSFLTKGNTRAKNKFAG